MERWIATRSAKQFDPWYPRADLIDPADIAAGLSCRCRFSGQCREFYSVAQHSVICASVARQQRLGAELVRWALLHDAAEAYLPDVCRPIKAGLGWFDKTTHPMGVWRPFAEVEAAIEACVATRFGLPLGIPQEVREIDNRVLATERRELFGPNHGDWKLDAQPYAFAISPDLPAFAEAIFLSMFREVFS